MLGYLTGSLPQTLPFSEYRLPLVSLRLFIIHRPTSPMRSSLTPQSRYHRHEEEARLYRGDYSSTPAQAARSRYPVAAPPPSNRDHGEAIGGTRYRADTPSRDRQHTREAGTSATQQRRSYRHERVQSYEDESPSPPRRGERVTAASSHNPRKHRAEPHANYEDSRRSRRGEELTQLEPTGAAGANNNNNNFNEWWVTNLVQKDRFEATAPKHLSCCLCGDPALPFTVIAPCGHVVCKPCGDDSTRCPECEGRVVIRTVVPQMAGCVMASLSFECKTRRCAFSTLDPHEAFNHVCASTAVAADTITQGGANPQHLRSASTTSNPQQQRSESASNMPSFEFPAAVQQQQRSGSTVRSASSNPLDHVASSSWASTQQQQPQFISSYGQQPQLPTASTSPPLRTKQRKTMMFWDLESMQPSFYGLAPHLFFRKLLGCLVASCGVSSEVQSLVYCPDDLDTSVSTSLVELGVFTRVYPATGGVGKDAMETAAVACVSVDVRQLIQSVLNDINQQQQQQVGGRYGSLPVESETMYDIIIVSATARFILGCRKLLCEVSHSQPRSPFFMHVVSDMAALPMSQKIEIQRGAVTYVDAADFTRGNSAAQAR